MSYAERHDVALATDAGGAATGYTPVVTGKVVAVIYTKTDFDIGIDFVVTGEDSGLAIWSENDVNASATRYPRAATHSTAGAAALYAAAGTAVNDDIVVAKERIKVVVAQGGNVKSGKITVIIQ